ncbi:MAG: caspase family protein [Lautropia sp.]
MVGALLVSACAPTATDGTVYWPRSSTSTQPVPGGSTAHAAQATASRVPRESGASEPSPTIVVETGVHSGPVRRVAVFAKAGLVVTTSDDKSARIWDLSSGTLKRVFRPPISSGRRGGLYGAAAHPSERLVALAGATGDANGAHLILLVDPVTGELQSSFDAIAGDVRNLAWSSDGTVLLAVYAGAHGLRAFDRAGRVIYETRFAAASFALDASPRTPLVAAGARDGELLLLDARAGRVTERLRTRLGASPISAIAIAPDAARLAVTLDTDDAAPQVRSAADGSLIVDASLPRGVTGSFLSVAWSEDGRQILAGGRAYEGEPSRKTVYRFDAADGRLVDRSVAATDSVLELRTVPGAGTVYASFDGSWGVLRDGAVRLRAHATIADLRGPERLRIAPGGRALSWSGDGGTTTSSFDFDTRVLRVRGAPAALEPRTSTSMFSTSRWYGVRDPVVNGTSVRMAPDERSLSLAFLRVASAEAILGTSRRLIRLDASGRPRWAVRTDGEVRAVNVSADDRLAVTAMSDGTLRWWSAFDGSLLLTLLATIDGRWAAWTPSGHYDASPGADRMIGWAVTRAQEPASDFHSLNRFGSTFNRPDAIDRAIGVPQSRNLAASTHAAPAPSPSTRPTPPSRFPPSLRAGSPPSVDDGGRTLRIPFVYRASGVGVERQVRLNGRPADDARIVDDRPAQRTGDRSAVAVLDTPLDATLIQVLVRDENGYSEPLSFQYPGRASTVATASGGAASSGNADASRAEEPASAGASSAGAATAGASSAAAAALPIQELTSASQMAIAATKAGAAAAASVSTKAAAATAPSGEAAVAAPLASGGATGKAPFAPTQRLFLLSIGISKYALKRYELGLASKDAADFAKAMRHQQGRMYRSVETRLLADGDATRDAILESLDWLRNAVGPKDLGILFIAGHGLAMPDGRYLFLPVDFDDRRLAQTGVPDSAVREALGRMKGRALLFVDTCFGGAVLNVAGSTELRAMLNTLSSAENGVIVFASSTGRQQSLEADDWGNGAFTKSLLEGLSGKADLNGTGSVTFKGLDYYVSSAVERLTEGQQTPVSISPVGVADFALARP